MCTDCLLEESHDFEKNSTEATRRKLPTVCARYTGPAGGLGGGVEMRQVLARFPAMISTEESSSKPYPPLCGYMTSSARVPVQNLAATKTTTIDDRQLKPTFEQ